MISAAVTPCSKSGWLGLAILGVAEDGKARYVATMGAEVGRLVELPAPIHHERTIGKGKRQKTLAYTLTMVREVAPVDAEILAREVVGTAAAHGAERIVIEQTPDEGGGLVAERARIVGDAIAIEASRRGIPTELGKLSGGYYRTIATDLLRGVDGWPESAHDTERRAALLLLPDVKRSRAKPTEKQAPAERQEGTSGEPRAAPSPLLPDLEPIPSPPKLGVRTAGIDTGSAWFSVTITEGTAEPLTLVCEPRTFEVGRAYTETVRRRDDDGVWYDKTISRRTFDDSDTIELAKRIIAFLEFHGVDQYIVEKVKNANRVSDLARAQSQATQIARTQWHAAALWAAIALRTTIKALESTAATTWRAKVAGRSKGKEGGSGAERIPVEVRAAIYNWPNCVDEHGYDSGGIAIYGVRRAREEEAEQEAAKEGGGPAASPARGVRRARSKSGGADKSRALAKALVLEKRAAAGCTCPAKGRHRKECSLAKLKWCSPYRKDRKVDAPGQEIADEATSRSEGTE